LYPQIVNCRRLLYQNSVYGQGCNGDASFVASGFLLYCSSVSDIWGKSQVKVSYTVLL
jgi:hypothetical protein